MEMLAAEIYSPSGELLCTLGPDEIAWHDPEAMVIVQVIDAATSETKIWKGFPYNIRARPPAPRAIITPPGAGRIIGA